MPKILSPEQEIARLHYDAIRARQNSRLPAKVKAAVEKMEEELFSILKILRRNNHPKK